MAYDRERPCFTVRQLRLTGNRPAPQQTIPRKGTFAAYMSLGHRTFRLTSLNAGTP